jgi:hypothetical protein
MPITRTTMIDDDGTGLTGTILNNAWLQTIYNQVDTAIGAAFTPIAFNAAHFFAGAGGTWTVAGVVTWGACRTNNIVTLFLHIDESTVAGTPTFLHVAIPPTVPASHTVGIAFPFTNGAVAATGFCLVDHASQRLFLGVNPAFNVNWTAGPGMIRLVLTYPTSAAGVLESDSGDQARPHR